MFKSGLPDFEVTAKKGQIKAKFNSEANLCRSKPTPFSKGQIKAKFCFIAKPKFSRPVGFPNSQICGIWPQLQPNGNPASAPGLQ